jgi:Tfp pilus assembly protein PilV
MSDATRPDHRKWQLAFSRRPGLAIIVAVVLVTAGVVGFVRYEQGTSALRNAHDALNRHAWDDALADARIARDSLPQVFDAEAGSVESTATREKDAATYLGNAYRATDTERWDDALHALDAIPTDAVVASEASRLRNRVISLQHDDAEAQRDLADAQTALRLRQWDEALRSLAAVPASRPKAIVQAKDLSDRVFAVRMTVDVVDAAKRIAIANEQMSSSLSGLRYGTPSDKLTNLSIVRDRSRDIVAAGTRIPVVLRSEPGRDVMPSKLLVDKGISVSDDLARSADAILSDVQHLGLVLGRDADDFQMSYGKFSAWSQYFFLQGGGVSSYDVSTLERAGGVNSLQAYAANPDQNAELNLGWLIASGARSVDEGNAVLTYFADTGVVSTTLQALTKRLANPQIAVVYSLDPVVVWSAANESAAGAGELRPGTEVDDLSSAVGVDITGTKFVWYRRLRVHPSGQIVYLGPINFNSSNLVEGSQDETFAGVNPATPTILHTYLASRNWTIFSSLIGPLTGNNQPQILLTGSIDQCGSCHGSWLMVWDVEHQRPLWESTGDDTDISLLPSGNGFERYDAVRLPSEPLCCPSRLEVRSVTWNGETFVPGEAHFLNVQLPKQ